MVSMSSITTQPSPSSACSCGTMFMPWRDTSWSGACPIDIVELSAIRYTAGMLCSLASVMPLPPSLVAAPVVVMQPAMRPDAR